jgi:hypothetical protein
MSDGHTSTSLFERKREEWDGGGKDRMEGEQGTQFLSGFTLYRMTVRRMINDKFHPYPS